MFRSAVSGVFTCTIDGSGAAAKLTSVPRASGLRVGVHTIDVGNVGSGTVYIGGADVTPDTGIPLAAGEYRTFPLATKDAELYVIGGSVVLAEYI